MKTIITFAMAAALIAAPALAQTAPPSDTVKAVVEKGVTMEVAGQAGDIEYKPDGTFSGFDGQFEPAVHHAIGDGGVGEGAGARSGDAQEFAAALADRSHFVGDLLEVVSLRARRFGGDGGVEGEPDLGLAGLGGGGEAQRDEILDGRSEGAGDLAGERPDGGARGEGTLDAGGLSGAGRQQAVDQGGENAGDQRPQREGQQQFHQGEARAAVAGK